MILTTHESDIGYRTITVTWQPGETDLGQEAVVEIIGDVDEWPAEIDQDERDEIRERYAELVEAAEDEEEEEVD